MQPITQASAEFFNCIPMISNIVCFVVLILIIRGQSSIIKDTVGQMKRISTELLVYKAHREAGPEVARSVLIAEKLGEEKKLEAVSKKPKKEKPKSGVTFVQGAIG